MKKKGLTLVVGYAPADRRAEKVERLRGQVLSGGYLPLGRLVAGAIIEWGEPMLQREGKGTLGMKGHGGDGYGGR